jgi:type II secretory ATPase GspE/PulE/Tfp pilus assembly ATPase PilB-like protein/DNA-binding response OmpR family regulator
VTRILAVDDQPANLRLLREVLTPAGFEVVEARSGAEALVVAKESAPNLILLDMHLPDMHGLEVLRRLRESTWGAGLRVVAMSALASADDEKLWVQAGCVGTIEKPITIKTFVQDISRWLSGSDSASAAKREKEAPRRDKLGEALVEFGLITPEQLASALTAQATTSQRLAQILVEQGAASEDDLAWALSHKLGYPYVFLRPDIVDEETIRLLPETFLRKHSVLPILRFGHELTLVMADPTDQRTVDEVVSRTGLHVKRALAPISKIEALLDDLGARDGGTGQRSPTTEVQSLQFHLVQALEQGVSEIHFEPAIDGQARVRYRLEGVLVDRPGQPADLHTALLQHLRDLTGMGDAPLGTAAAPVTVGDVALYLMATFLPTIAGPMATITFYPSRSDVPDLAPLGVVEDRIDPLRQVLRAARGVVLVGCGDRWLRSTLLHALVPAIPGAKIWTLETLPVYHRPTLNQTILRSPAEVAAHLDEALRAGADLIVVDDVSRAEAMRAAHDAGRTRLVLAGHPQDDVVDLFGQALDVAGSALTASVLRGILTAQPIRLLCPLCKQAPVGVSGSPTGRTHFAPHGCEACGFTGYRGRRVLTEVWTLDPDVRLLLRSGQGAAAHERVAVAVGSQKREQGQALAEDGLTSLDELAKVGE